MTYFSDLEVGESFDGDDDLCFEINDTRGYLRRNRVVELRDHLTGILGDTPTTTAPAAPRPLAMPPADALKVAEEMVVRLAPTANARGYADGVAPLRDRMDSILRVADFLMKGGS